MSPPRRALASSPSSSRSSPRSRRSSSSRSHRVSAHQSQIASERPAGPTVDFIAAECRRLPDRRPAILGSRDPDRRPCPSRAHAATRLGRAAADRRRRASRAAALRHERRRRGRPPLHPRHRSGVLRRGTGTALQERGRGAARAAHAGRSDDGRRASVWRRDGAVHVGHRAHPAGGGPRDRPGIAQRDRIRSRVPHAPVPRIARGLLRASSARRPRRRP